MQTTHKRFELTSFFATMLLASSVSIPAAAQHSATIPAGQTVLTFVNRLLINPPQVVVFGYFADIAGISGPLFSGTPGENTAHFTWSLNAPGALQLQNGDLKDPGGISVAVLRSGETFNVYYNANPSQSWNFPESFSAGSLIATFKSSPGTQAGAGPMSFVTQSYSLVSSHDFTFKGQTYNFRRLIPHGFTSFGVVGNIPLHGAVAPPLTFAGAGSAAAIGGLASALP
jgi:hypothetical protein